MNLVIPRLNYARPNGGPLCQDAKMTRSDRVCWDCFRVNHCIIKSWTEYIECKMPRRCTFSSNEALTKSLFLGDEKNECHQPLPSNYLETLNSEIQKIKDAVSNKGFSADQLNYCNGSVESLSSAQSGPIEGCVDNVWLGDGRLFVQGWALAWRQDALQSVQVEVNGQLLPPTGFERVARPDVLLHHSRAALACGFSAKCVWTPQRSPIRSLVVRGVANEGFSEPLELGKFVDPSLLAA